jgi:sugar phosphate isomerase/epimerase
MKLGFNSVLFGGHPVETAFRYAAICGYDGIEISAIANMSEHMIGPAALKELAARYNIPILAMEQPSQDPATMESAMRAAVEMGCPIINCGPGGKSNDEATFQQSIESLGRLADMAGKFGVTLCVKAHVGAAIYNTPTTLRALEAIQSPWFGLDMDPSHIHRAGEDPVAALGAVIKRIKHVHIRDCKGRQQDPGPPEMQANGRGDINLLGYIRTLHEAGYAGPVNLEVIGAKSYDVARCVAIAAEARGHMQACLQACGAR